MNHSEALRTLDMLDEQRIRKIENCVNKFIFGDKFEPTRKHKVKYKENYLPSDVDVHVMHLHKGNSSRRERKGHDYRTLAMLMNKEHTAILGFGESRHGHHDGAPCRAVGRAVAIGRAMKDAGIGNG